MKPDSCIWFLCGPLSFFSPTVLTDGTFKSCQSRVLITGWPVARLLEGTCCSLSLTGKVTQWGWDCLWIWRVCIFRSSFNGTLNPCEIDWNCHPSWNVGSVWCSMPIPPSVIAHIILRLHGLHRLPLFFMEPYRLWGESWGRGALDFKSTGNEVSWFEFWPHLFVSY